MRKRIKDGNFRLVAGIWSDNGWAVHIFILVDGDENMDVPIYYQTIIPATTQIFPSFIL